MANEPASVSSVDDSVSQKASSASAEPDVENLAVSASEAPKKTEIPMPSGPKTRYEWYQTETHVVVSVLVKNVKKEDLKCDIQESNVEIKLKKLEGWRWEKLESDGSTNTTKQFNPGQSSGDNVHKYPSSSHCHHNWDALEAQMKAEEKDEKLEGDAALNKLFQQIYTDGNDETRRAMNKSFQESGGTVLSTNWKDIEKQKTDCKPPDGMEYKKWEY